MIANKITIIHKDGLIEYIGDVLKGELHSNYLRDYVKSKHPTLEVESLDLEILMYHLIMDGDVIILNMLGGKNKYASMFLPNSIDEIQRSSLLNIVNLYENFTVTISYDMYYNDNELLGRQKIYKATGNFNLILCQLCFFIELNDNRGRN